MNKQRLEHLAQWLEAGALHERITFDMDEGISFKVDDFDPDRPTDCRTACCLAGAAVQFFGDETWLAEAMRRQYSERDAFDKHLTLPFWGPYGQQRGHNNVLSKATELLGLTRAQAKSLFVPGGWLPDYNDPQWAARTIRHLIATGKVDWDATEEQ